MRRGCVGGRGVGLRYDDVVIICTIELAGD